MKKIIGLMLTFVLTMCMSIMADNLKVITFDQLPMQAQTVLKQHFADRYLQLLPWKAKNIRWCTRVVRKRNSIRRVNG